MASNVNLSEGYGLKRTSKGVIRSYDGEVEIIIKDVHGRVIDSQRHKNIIKIFAKETLSHRMPHSKVWDPNAGTGTGAWVSSGIDPLEEFSAKYIFFGASFDENGAPLDTVDPRYYSIDPVTGSTVPNQLGVGAEFDGGLINPIPLADPDRPLKKIERIFFEPSYQPSGTPLLQDDVRAMNNIVVLETTPRKDEYNGFGLTSSDFFTITEVALGAGTEMDFVGACDCIPRNLLMEGRADGKAITVNLSGSETITIDAADIAYVDTIKEGDQIKLLGADAAVDDEDPFNQVTPYYLVISKATGGSDITLDRTPVDVDNVAITGQAGIFRTTMRLFSHRILRQPVKKSADFEIVVRWRIIFN
jgi:hypothetical protein